MTPNASYAEPRLRPLVERTDRAATARDVDAIMALLAPDVRTFEFADCERGRALLETGR